jgi:ATP-binding protein involved in chromosome partitioning
MAEVTEAQVRAALGRVVDPDRGQDVVSAGMIEGLAIQGGKVQFAIAVRPEEGRTKENLRRACEAAVDALPGVLAVTAVLTAERQAPPGPKPAAGGRGQPLPGVGAIIAVASGKGGVGKSTVAVNLAAALGRSGLKVGLLDADIYGPSLPRLIGKSGKPATTPDGKAMIPHQAWGLKLMSVGFMLPNDDTPLIWRGPMATNLLQQMLRQVEWGELDVLVIDLPPGTGDVQLSLAQVVPVTGAVIVSTPQDIALMDARKGLAMFRKVDVPILGIVENMSFFCCPNCGHRTDIFAHGGARQAAAELKVDFLGEVPLHMEIRELSDAGTPVVMAKPDGENAKAYAAIAARVAGKLSSTARPAAPKITFE